jgi:Protein of unknown function (DUF3352)
MTHSLLPRRRARLAGVVAAVALGAAGVAGCGDSSGGSSSGGGNADPAALLPASTPVYVEAQVQPTGDLAASEKAVAGKILRTPDPGGKVVGWIDQALKDDGASFSKDVEPWLGQRAGLAVMAVGAGGDDADVVAAVASKDDDAARRFVDEQAGKGGVERSYQGVKYEYKSANDVAAAVVDGAVIVGTEKGFKSAIDAQKAGRRLADSAPFKKARDVVGTDGAGFAYADPGRFFDLAAGAASGKLSQGDGQSLQAFKALLAGSGLQSVAASLNVARDALQVDAAAIGMKASAAGAGRGDGPGAAAAVPAGSWLSVGIGDVSGTVQNALKSFGSAGGIDPELLLQGLKSQLGFDVQKDLLSWMGDAALFVRGTTMKDLNGALVVESKDPAASKAAIPKLRALLKQVAGGVGPLKNAPAGASGFSIDARSSLPSTVDVATKDDKFVIAIGSDALRDALSPGSSTLGDSGPFRTAASLLGDAKPSMFLDTPQVVKLIGSLAGNDPDFQKAKPTLDTFGPAAAGVSGSGDVTRLKAAVAVP